jgi:glycosyltransferase involved in cell wall biosynthesis
VGFLRDSFFLWPAALLRCRILIHLHGSHFRQWYERLGNPLHAYVRWTLRTVTRAIVLGESLRGVFKGLVPADRISVVPNGIKGGHDKPRGERDPARRRYRLLHLSTLSRQKGALVVLAAIPRVIEKRRDVEFILAGDWLREEDRMAAESLIRREALEGYVQYTGTVAGDRKERLYQSADLFLFPGIQPEGQPLVLLEAMAAGLPVLFTNQGCIGETVIQRENGLQVEVDDPADLASKILWCLDHPGEMQAMGVRSRIRYEARYTDEQFKERMAEVVRQTLEDGR